MTPTGRHVTVVLQGGIGNQLFQFCAGESIRQATGYPVLYDCDTGFRNDTSARRFELAPLIPPDDLVPPPPEPQLWRKQLQERLAAAIEHKVMFPRGICSLPRAMTLRAVRFCPADEFVCRGCFQLLEFLNGETVERIRRVLGVRHNRTDEVAVHFRLARDQDASGKTMPEHDGTVLSLDYYRAAIRMARTQSRNLCFRVFSDSGVVPEDVFDPRDTVVLDQPLQDEPPSITLSRMARCSRFVIANSTFSWWAAYLAEGETKQVYAPQSWLFHRGCPSQRGIFPSEWRRL